MLGVCAGTVPTGLEVDDDAVLEMLLVVADNDDVLEMLLLVIAPGEDRGTTVVETSNMIVSEGLPNVSTVCAVIVL